MTTQCGCGVVITKMFPFAVVSWYSGSYSWHVRWRRRAAPPLIELAVTRQNTDIGSVLDTDERLQVTRQQHLHVINHKASNLKTARTRLGFFFPPLE